MANSKSLQAYVNSVKAMWPNATVWTEGDEAHRGSPSDHNNDDQSGSKPEQVDSDNIAEIRAADIPKRGGVTMADLDTLRARLTDRPSNRARAKYVILRQTIWRRNGGWVPEVYRGQYHDHLHMSHHVTDDNNGAPWDIDNHPQQTPTPPPAPVAKRRNEDDMKEYLWFKRAGDRVGNSATGAVTWACERPYLSVGDPLRWEEFTSAARANGIANVSASNTQLSEPEFDALRARYGR